MGDFRGRHFGGEVILWAVRWYCRYGVSYRDLEQMLAERGITVDRSAIHRRVQRYAPEMEKRLRWSWKRPSIRRSWRVDETWFEVAGKWAYLCRAVDKDGDTIGFSLSPTRSAATSSRLTTASSRCRSGRCAGSSRWEQPTPPSRASR